MLPLIFREMNKEQGTPKLLYSSECYNDDVPYWVDLPYEKDLPDEEKEGMLLIVSQKSIPSLSICNITLIIWIAV